MARWIANTAGMLSLMALAAFTGCGGDKTADADKKFRPVAEGDAAPAAIGGGDTADAPGVAGVQKPPAGAQPDLEKMPAGSPEELLGYIGMLGNYSPRGITKEDKTADLIRVRRLMVEAADLVLNDPKSTEDQRYQGAESKVMAVNDMAKFGEPKADQELVAVCSRLAKDSSAKVARYGRVMLFNISVAKLHGGETKNVPQVFDELKSLLTGPDDDHLVYIIGKQAASVFFELKEQETARATLRMLGARYKDDKNAQVAADAVRMLREEELLGLGYVELMEAVAKSTQPNPKTADDLIAVTTRFVGETPGELEYGVASTVAEALERTDHYDHAAKMLNLIADKFARATDPKIVPLAKDLVERGQLRHKLLGQKLALSGKLLNGEDFDASQLKGKIVLVDFWATWCPICLEEFPNIQENLERYRDKGFEVVGYNLDDRREHVNEFFRVQPLPWSVLVSNDSARQGLNSPLAQECGVKGLPLTLLLDGEGTVIAMHLQGEKLNRKLAELLGPPAATPPATTPPAAEDKPAAKVGARPKR